MRLSFVFLYGNNIKIWENISSNGSNLKSKNCLRGLCERYTVWQTLNNIFKCIVMSVGRQVTDTYVLNNVKLTVVQEHNGQGVVIEI